MSDVSVFRLALKDSTHPMYSIAWDIFRAKFNPDKVAKRHGERRDEILPFLYEILDAEELYAEGSLGSGFAPINTLSLLGAWQVVEAIPRLLTYLDDDDEDAIVNDRAAYALQQMPPEEAIDPLLEYGQRDGARAMDAMFILTHVGKGDERCFDFICCVFERMSEEFDIITVAECLAINNLEKAKPYLREQSQKKQFRHYRSDFENIIEVIKEGNWD